MDMEEDTRMPLSALPAVTVVADEPGEADPTVSSSAARQVLRRLRADPRAIVGCALLGLMVALALLAPLLAGYNPNTVDLAALNQGPSPAHWLGTDYLGRDMWARILYGGRVSLPAGLGVIAIALAIGVPLGMVAGFAGGYVDDLIMRLFDVLLCVPGILLALGVVAILGPGLTSAVIAIGVATTPSFARLARASTLRAKEQDYVEAARAQGAGPAYIAVRHILPNIVDPIIVLATLGLGTAILATAALSYLGVGTQLPTSDWGSLLSNGFDHMFQSWGEVTFPGLAIGLTVFGINLLGDGLGHALNPRSHRR
jgi:peptide/nickel transport system permease protein